MIRINYVEWNVDTPQAVYISTFLSASRRGGGGAAGDLLWHDFWRSLFENVGSRRTPTKQELSGRASVKCAYD